MIECIDTRFFKRRRNSTPYIDEQIGYGYLCPYSGLQIVVVLYDVVPHVLSV